MTNEGKSHVFDINQVARRSSAAVTASDNSFCSVRNSDAEEDNESIDDHEDEHRCSSGSSGSSGTEIVGLFDKMRRSSKSQCAVEVDLESGRVERKVHLGKVKQNCRICHVSFDGSNSNFGVAIELGCSCKEDLAAAHKQCAEAWFKIRGNKTCEICGSIARNVDEANDAEPVERCDEANSTSTTAAVPTHQADPRNFWQGHRILNFLLACMVFAFVISWLLHFNVPS
ncbi:hypothetical protein Nepgr_028656 [Nepenthes gracilis]|uniref:RING-CH-type domain-containing protein n=1 Tax=Nepenthes gracilis TaxID=150966 RepID=A0AAD3TCR1_NEPGR|nr:hypothetical protein Nepgr_028656 [Nepenthes gracilis]